MAKASTELINAIKATAKSLQNGASYQWGHMGSCNCGNLAQQVTGLSKAQIHEKALKGKGDWNDQCDEFCPTSGLPMDDLISSLLDIGLDIDDLKNLEKLSDKKVLSIFPIHQRNLKHNLRDDVVKYMRAWAEVLEEELTQKIEIKDAFQPANEYALRIKEKTYN